MCWMHQTSRAFFALTRFAFKLLRLFWFDSSRRVLQAARVTKVWQEVCVFCFFFCFFFPPSTLCNTVNRIQQCCSLHILFCKSRKSLPSVSHPYYFSSLQCPGFLFFYFSSQTSSHIHFYLLIHSTEKLKPFSFSALNLSEYVNRSQIVSTYCCSCSVVVFFFLSRWLFFFFFPLHA